MLLCDKLFLRIISYCVIGDCKFYPVQILLNNVNLFNLERDNQVMTLESLLQKLIDCPESIEFNDTMCTIDSMYDFTPTSFENGDLVNEAGQNSGSCKLFSFARIHKLTLKQTLACFGSYYRDDVLKHPEKEDHQNIRNFMKSGWPGIKFDSEPLVAKSQ